MPTQPSTRRTAGLVLVPSKLKQLRRIGPASDGVFESLSNDPHCRLQSRRTGALRTLAPGDYDIVAVIIGIHGSVLGPEVHVDHDGADSLRVAMEPGEAGIFIARVRIDRPLAGLRLDPTNRNGKLVLGPIWIQPRLDDDQAGPVPLPLRALLKLVDWTVPASAARCRAKAGLLVRGLGDRMNAAAIAARVIGDLDRRAINNQLESAFRKVARERDYAALYRSQLQAAQGARGPAWRDRVAEPVSADSCSVKAVAFYLPQFHPIPENDRWWGEGFTEWRNVGKAVPQFVGHQQPRRPAELGYYDLRNVEVMRRQIALAKAHGLHGFCFHHYWFHGTRLLERPVDQFLADPTLDLPFCLCWANENWTRRWDGAEHEILIAQDHSPEDDLAFFRDLSRYLRDPRYIRIEGRPLVIVYRPDLLPAPAETAARWRAEAEKIGLPGLFLAATNAFGFADHRAIGFDALVEFPPHARPVPVINETLTFYNPDHAGMVHAYADIVAAPASEALSGAFVIPGVMPGWDNEARRPGRGKTFHGATPELFARWLNAGFARARESAPEGRRFVFINAWNEWAEAAYLEPDQDNGFAYLAALADVVRARAALERKS
ncbi:MAG TPA: glycoside hydrolase family 99-like domain-containing protein [Alphaproteobacteria bacterium]|nr:glycoside hydrolase family 99-like domain-containing protein [Alphaproteobacteria bacterium]